MKLDGMRIERLFHVEHPIGTPSFCDKFKIRNKVADFGHTTFEVIHNALEFFVVRRRGNNLFYHGTGACILFEERSRVCFVFRQDAVDKRESVTSIFLLRKLLANLHEESMQALFGFGKCFRKLIANFMQFGLFRRNTA